MSRHAMRRKGWGTAGRYGSGLCEAGPRRQAISVAAAACLGGGVAFGPSGRLAKRAFGQAGVWPSGRLAKRACGQAGALAQAPPAASASERTGQIARHKNRTYRVSPTNASRGGDKASSPRYEGLDIAGRPSVRGSAAAPKGPPLLVLRRS
jgi:hypothetical protein